MEKTDFPARYFSCWGLLGPGQLAVCRISKGWSAGAELCEVCQALGWCRCLCFLWNQPVGVGAALPGANLCIPSPAKDQRPALPLAPRGDRRTQQSNGDVLCWEGVCSGPCCSCRVDWEADSGQAIPPHPWGAVRRGQAGFTDFSKAL